MARWLALGFAASILAVIGATIVAFYVLWSFGRGLPDEAQLAEYEPPVMSRVHAGDGSLIAEYARERRLFVPIDAIPQRVIGAFLSAEDKTFYSHPGLDFQGILRAMVVNVGNVLSGRRPVGASTITQQVAKNFLLTNEVSYERKIKEAILALRIEDTFDKDQILELYLNEIYLGRSAYGVASAALNYFGKSLDELTVEEAAYLAALPKAPNNYHPTRYPARAVSRRNWVISRMAANGVISDEEAEVAQQMPLDALPRYDHKLVDARYFVSAIRQELIGEFGEYTLYEGGLSIRTTVETRLQRIGQQALRDGLADFDRRKGYRGPQDKVALQDMSADEWQAHLAMMDRKTDYLPWRHAVVLKLENTKAHLGFANGARGTMVIGDISWARPINKNGLLGNRPKKPGDIMKVGHIILAKPADAKVQKSIEAVDTALAAPLEIDEDGNPIAREPMKPKQTGNWYLRQVPEVNGALIAMDPHTGRVLALVGGFSFGTSKYNRAIQASRQPGSAFKPFIYAAALENGFTPSSLVLDAPFVLDQGPGKPKWKPENYSDRFYGPSTLRLGIEKSRNLMTVRLAQYIGMDTVVNYVDRFGIKPAMAPTLSLALGAGEVPVIKLATAYAMLANGGKRIKPTLIDRVQNRRGQTIFQSDMRECVNCAAALPVNASGPDLPDTREQVIQAGTAYQVTSMMEGVVQRGTGIKLKSLGMPLAGKTGTTNESRDAWFMGYTPNLVVGVYVGYDTPKPLGRKETGSSVAVPIFKSFMEAALKDVPAIPFRIPPGLSLVRVDARTGLPAPAGQRDTILEAFKPGTEPTADRLVLDDAFVAYKGSNISGTGGLY